MQIILVKTSKHQILKMYYLTTKVVSIELIHKNNY